MESEKQKELFMNAWRASDFYDWIHQILEEEITSTYVKDQVVAAAQAGTPMSSEEIGDAMKTEVQAQLRLQSVKERIK